MLSLLILIILLVILGKIFLGMALEVAGAIIGILLVLVIALFKRKKGQ